MTDIKLGYIFHHVFVVANESPDMDRNVIRLYSMQHVEIPSDVILTHLMNIQQQPHEFIVVDTVLQGMWSFNYCAALYECICAVVLCAI